MRGITLIGMPGSGKSTVGRMLAQSLNCTFLDLDEVLAAGEGKNVDQILKEKGGNALVALEARYILDIPLENMVLSPGGSIVYSKEAMEYIRAKTKIVFLDVSLAALRRRINNIDVRGVVGIGSKTLDAIYAERLPLYRAYADITIEASDVTAESVTGEVLKRVRL